MCSYEADVARLCKLYAEVPTDEDSDGDDDSVADPDFEEVLEHETDSEQEDDNNFGNLENVEPQSKNSDLYYFGKDNKTKWRKEPSAQNVRTKQFNLVSHLPGVIGNAKNLTTVHECWNLFYDEYMIHIIVKNTNTYIQTISKKFKDKYDVNLTDSTEIKALIGLLYLAGVLHGGRLNILEFWSTTSGMGAEIFPATMALRRFRFLLRCLRFDDIMTREERKKVDKMTAVRSLVEKFNENCKKPYTLGEYVTLDEMLLAFRGRCGFRVYIPNKPNKYGLKVYSLVDSRTFYTSHLELYTGKQPSGPYEVSNTTADVVYRMCKPILGTGRNVTMDRWFTSYVMVKTMRDLYKTTVVATIRSNKRELPPAMVQSKGREQYSSLFGFSQDMTLVSYVPRKGKFVLVVSSMHNDNKIDKSTGEQKKPEVITFYNLTKGGVDSVDHLASSYDVARNTKRWPMVVFYGLLNVAAINAFVIFTTNKPTEEMNRRTFLRSLGTQLVMENMKRRAVDLHIPRAIRQSAIRLSGVEETKSVPPPNKRGRCKYCKDRKTKYYCKCCNNWLCLEHVVIFCQECSEKK